MYVWVCVCVFWAKSYSSSNFDLVYEAMRLVVVATHQCEVYLRCIQSSNIYHQHKNRIFSFAKHKSNEPFSPHGNCSISIAINIPHDEWIAWNRMPHHRIKIPIVVFECVCTNMRQMLANNQEEYYHNMKIIERKHLVSPKPSSGLFHLPPPNAVSSFYSHSNTHIRK